MNIIYIDKDKLNVVQYSQLPNKDLSLFFSSSKHSLVYVEDENNKVIGFIDHNLYKQSKATNEVKIKKFGKVLIEEKSDFSQIETLFETNLDIVAIPVLNENNNLIGAYVRTIPEELSSFDKVMNCIALAVLPAFIEEFLLYIKTNGIKTIYLIANENDFVKFCDCFNSFVEIQHYDNTVINSHSIIIDMLYSKTYRQLISKSINHDIVSLEHILAIIILPIAINYVKSHNASLYFIEGLIKEKIKESNLRWPQLYSGLTLAEAVSDNDLIKAFCNGDMGLVQWSKDINNGILGGDEVCTNGLHLLMSENLNGMHYDDAKPRIFIYGPCFVYGTCVPKSYRLQIILSKMFPKYSVVNCGVKNGHSLLNDLLYILNTDIKAGDILIDMNVFPIEESITIKEKCGLSEFSLYFNKYMDDECQFLDNTFHANAKVTYLAATFIKTLIPDNKIINSTNHSSRYLFETNKISKIDTKSIIGKSLMSSYIEYIKGYRRETRNGQVVGSVMLTANPLTKGHEYLIGQAKSKCDLLYVFIVEENSFYFTTTERLNIVRSVIKDPNIVILTTGNVMTARYTFPDYYQQNHTKTDVSLGLMSDLHFFLFGSVVAPLLNITKRFVGEEVKGSVTDYYNNKLLAILPSYGIEVEIIPRLCCSDGTVISASLVRELIDKQDGDSLSKLISPVVVEYIKRTRFEHVLRLGRWSCAYRKGANMIKRYNYYLPEAAKRESLASQAAFSAGINTPKFIQTIDDGASIANVFEYMDLTAINTSWFDFDEKLFSGINNILNFLPNVHWREDDNYWKESLLIEFKDALRYLKIDINKYTFLLDGLIPEVFIHGDFTCDNLGLSSTKGLVVFDFQHGCLGPKGWDKAYIASTMHYNKCIFELNEQEKQIAETISAIRYGRAIRKNDDIQRRKALFVSWINHLK